MFDKVECEIFGLSSNPAAGGAYVLLLREVDGNRRLPIIIGAFEAQAIAMELENMSPPRPLTHDLLKNVIYNLGASVVEIFIDELKDNTFHAKIIVEVSSLTNEIDARPSDAIALAVRTSAPIYVSESVLSNASFTPSSEATNTSSKDDEYTKYENESLKTKEASLSSLEKSLKEAIDDEDYEKAAKLRDEINRLNGYAN